MTVGVLDDDPAICRFLEVALSIAGYKVYAFTNPTDFIDSVYPNRIDYFQCVIVDFHLSGPRSGIEVIRAVKMDYAHLPAILISADFPAHVNLEGLADVVLFEKPFRLSRLLDLMHMLQEERA